MSFSYGDNCINTADLQERIDELESDSSGDMLMDEELRDELAMLHGVRDELSYCWGDGQTLVLDDYFEDYMQEFAFDCGEIDRRSSLVDHIDWKGYAAGCLADYRAVDLAGTTYQVRS